MEWIKTMDDLYFEANRSLAKVGALLCPLRGDGDWNFHIQVPARLTGNNAPAMLETIKGAKTRLDTEYGNVCRELYPVPLFSRLKKILRRVLFRAYFSDKNVAQLRLLGERATALRQSME